MTDQRCSKVLAQLDNWTPNNERGASCLERMKTFLHTARVPFDRDRGAEHITGSAIVISSVGVLLHQHKLSAMWIGPGGHVDGGEHPWEAAERETVEETGVLALQPPAGPTLLNVDVHETSNGHIHLDLAYLLVAEPGKPNPPEDESQEVEWFGVSEALQTTDGSHAVAIRRAIELGFLS